MTEVNLDLVKVQAKKEIEAEKFRAAVELYKAKLKRRKWYDRLWPWRIVFIRREVL